jgi:hypothetical protein
VQDHEKVISELDMKVKSTERTVAGLRTQLTEVQNQRENFKVWLVIALCKGSGWPLLPSCASHVFAVSASVAG